MDIIGGQNGADPASIVYDAVAAAKARNADVLICDTAGRLHNKKNLMEELHKIYRILEKEYPEAYLETLVVLDGTTGQNALQQARQFAEVANVTGIILTKLDGTARAVSPLPSSPSLIFRSNTSAWARASTIYRNLMQTSL